MNTVGVGTVDVFADVIDRFTIPSIELPPFFFHYVIVFICICFIVCVCLLKFNYLYWYTQPITFWFTIRRWTRNKNGDTSIMNALSLSERCNNALVYPFLRFVNHDSVTVYGSRGCTHSITDAPYEKLALFLSRRENEVVMLGRRRCLSDGGDFMHIQSDQLEYILSQETHGLSVFIGVIGGRSDSIKGLCIMTPRIMVYTRNGRSVSMYVCDYLAWSNYVTTERESLELLETTEYIQKSREIAGEQTLYRYNEIPWFVIPFTTVYTYTFSVTPPGSSRSRSRSHNRTIGTDGLSIIPVSSANFALFYAFVNECARDFRYCIFNELTQLQALVQGGLYRIYMLVLNKVRIIAVYIFESSWMKVRQVTPRSNMKPKMQSKKTRGNRISALHDYISRTSTAVVKYLPPVVKPEYDLMGKRIKNTTIFTDRGNNTDKNGDDILLLKSSIRHTGLCKEDTFMKGFVDTLEMVGAGASAGMTISIDTVAHNYLIIDSIMIRGLPSWNFIVQNKWYYILYNAIIHEEVRCKDILII